MITVVLVDQEIEDALLGIKYLQSRTGEAYVGWERIAKVRRKLEKALKDGQDE